MNGKLNETIGVSALWSTMRALWVWDTNMLVSQKPGRPNVKPGKASITPNTSRWNILHIGQFHVGIALDMTKFHVVCVNFVRVG